jgi:hypothetical protein
MRARMRTVCLIVVGALAISVAALQAQAQAPAAAGQTASQFYMAYRVAFDKATKMDDLLPYMSADQLKMINAAPPEQRSQGFEIIKLMGTMTGVKITKEEKSGSGAKLTVEGLDNEKKKLSGTIDIVREGNVWKLGKESWSN